VAYIFLQIGTDPTAWVLEDAEPDAVAAQLSQATGPVVLPVTGPLQGDLVISPPAAATISVQRPSPMHGAHPSHLAVPRWPVLYLPSPAGPAQDSPGYPLAPGADLAALKKDIIAAMSEGTFLSVQLADLPGGVVLLNGAALAFAVLAQIQG
jgi:hypothetical protein